MRSTQEGGGPYPRRLRTDVGIGDTKCYLGHKGLAKSRAQMIISKLFGVRCPMRARMGKSTEGDSNEKGDLVRTLASACRGRDGQGPLHCGRTQRGRFSRSYRAAHPELAPRPSRA